MVIVESEPILVGRICFYNGTNHEPHQCEPDYVVDFYYVEKSKAALGIPPSTDEMKEPAWFPFDPLPPNLKPGDELFMPQFLQKKVLHGYVHFHDNGQVLKSYLVECDPKCLELD